MSETTILKMYDNGDLETFVPIQQASRSYSFKRDSINVPRIIEYPPQGYRNYFIEKTSVEGYISGVTGNIQPPEEYERVSDFISIYGWESFVVRVEFKNLQSNSNTWLGISQFTGDRGFISFYIDDFVLESGYVGDAVIEYYFPIWEEDAVEFIRVSVNYYDDPLVDVKVSIENGTVATQKHYLAPEDMPIWAIDTGNPVSIFPEGIVIKGDLIESQI